MDWFVGVSLLAVGATAGWSLSLSIYARQEAQRRERERRDLDAQMGLAILEERRWVLSEVIRIVERTLDRIKAS